MRCYNFFKKKESQHLHMQMLALFVIKNVFELHIDS